MKNRILVVLLFLALASFTFFIVKQWEIAPGYTIHFDGKYAHGDFKDLKGTIIFDPQNLTSSRFDVTIDVASIDTGIELKNKHARSDKWFDAEQFPTIRFKSQQIARSEDNYMVSGQLEVKGITKAVQIPFAFDPADPAFRGSFKVDRGDFGIGKVNGKDSDSTTVEIFVPVLIR